MADFWKLDKRDQDTLVPCTVEFTEIAFRGLSYIAPNFSGLISIISCDLFGGKLDQQTELHLSSTGSGSTTSRSLLDKPVGLKCLAALMGIGQQRLRRATSGAPDMRYGKKAHRFRPGTWTADSFLQVSYDSIAETLPDKSHASFQKNIWTW